MTRSSALDLIPPRADRRFLDGPVQLRRLRRLFLALGLLLFACAAVASGAAQEPSQAGGAFIRPGDHIVLRILGEPEMSDTFVVAPSGEAVLPWLNAIDVTRYTAASLPSHLRTEYTRFLRDPRVDIAVLRRIGVHGEVTDPDLYWVDLSMTVRDVIALAGGVTEAGNPNRVEIVRGTERIRLGPDQGAALSTHQLQSGDHVVVARRSWFARNYATAIGGAGTLLGILLTLSSLTR